MNMKICDIRCRILFFLCFYLLNFSSQIFCQPLGYLYGKNITINSSIVTGTNNLIDFPILFHFTDPDLKSTSNGGNVFNTNGNDIIFTSSNCLTNLYHQVEKYDPSTGELICWIRLPILSYSVNTIISMYFGNPNIVSTTSSSNTWTGDYSSVLHLSDSPLNSIPQMIDGSGNLNSGTCLGTMSSTNSVNGKIASAILFDEIDDGIVLSDFDYTSSFTISFWLNLSEATGNSYQYLFSHGNFMTYNSLSIYFGEESLGITADRKMLKNIFQDSNDSPSTSGLDGGNTYVDGNWHYYTFVVGNSGSAIVYVDAVQTASLSYLGGNSYDPASNIYIGSRSDLSSSRFFGGKIDEFRILSVPRSSDWIATEFTNQNNATSNFTLGAISSASVICTFLPIELVKFNAINNGDRIVIEWTTASETNNDYFIIERSENASDFKPIAKIKGVGNNSYDNKYLCFDELPNSDIVYYRLKQVDYDGTFSYSSIVSVLSRNSTLNINVFPNPFSDFVVVQIDKFYHLNNTEIRVVNYLGQVVKSFYIEGNKNELIDLSDIEDGIYILDIPNFNNSKVKVVKYSKF